MIKKNIVQTFSFEGDKNMAIYVLAAQQEVPPIQVIINPSLSNGSDLQKGGRVGHWLQLGVRYKVALRSW